MVILELAGAPPVIGGSNRSFLFLFHFTWHIKVNGWNAKPCVSCSQARCRPLYFSWSLWALGKCHKPPSLHSRQMAEPPPGTSAWIPDPQDREHNTWLWWATKFEFVSVSIKSRNEPWEPQETRPHISKRQLLPCFFSRLNLSLCLSKHLGAQCAYRMTTLIIQG